MRGKSQRHSGRQNQNYSNQLDLFGRHDPFRQMNSIMRSFGGFGGSSLFNDDFFKDDFMMKPFGDPMQRMMGFSDLHQKAHRGGKDGTYVCQTFVSSSTMGPDGKLNKQSYYENSVGEHKNGKTISQKQQAYKNSDGVNRIAQQRMLNDKGHKIVKQKRGNDIEQTNHYYNIQQDQAQNFHNSWKQQNQQMKFLENYDKYQKGISYGRNQQPRQLGIGYGQPQQRNLSRREPPENNHRRIQEGSRGSQRDNYSVKGSQKQFSNVGSRGSRKY